MSLILRRRLAVENRYILGELQCPQNLNIAAFTIKTLELPWRDNKKHVSCIPPGKYPLLRRMTGGYYQTYAERWGHGFSIQVGSVPERDAILIHTGNTSDHTRGCILVGGAWGPNGILGGTSWPAYQRLYDYLDTLDQHQRFLDVMETEIGRIESDSEAESVRDHTDVL